MASYAARTDLNQNDIVQALRGAGCTVEITSQVGHGFPDLVVECRGENVLIEVKGPRGRLTPKEQLFHEKWRGPLYIARTPEQILAELNLT